MTPESAAATLRRNRARAEVGGGAVRCEVDPEQVAAVLTVIRDELGFALLSSITAVDEGDHIRLLYHLARPGDPEHTRLLLVEVRAAKGEHPEGPLVPSAVAVYPGANLQEREIFDLMGVRFRGHPNLTRVLTWTGFHGHPLRKDYEPVDEEIPWRLAGLAGADGALISTDDAALAGDERAAVALVDAPAAEATGRVPPGRGELVKVNFGPHHPSTHGVLHLLLTLDGETVVDCEVIFGYLHRAIEKLAEQRTYVGGQALCDRLDYVAAMTNNHAWTLATEALLDIEPPLKVQVIRVMMDELSRIASHWIGTGVYGQDVGVLVTSVMWAFNWREEILDVFEDWCGQRMTYNYYRPGTVYPQRLPDGYEAKIRAICDRTPGRVEQMHRFLTRNAIFRERSVGVGGLSAADALAHSVTGPTLRGSGVAYDIRRARPYAIYRQLDFDVATRDAGDCMARYQVRLDEILESRRIVLQCLDLLAEVDPDMGREPKQVKPAAGREAYVEVEGPKGAVGCYMKANGTPNPERMKWRSPSFINLGAFPLMVRGWKIADLISIFGSVDINMGEVDR